MAFLAEYNSGKTKGFPFGTNQNIDEIPSSQMTDAQKVEVPPGKKNQWLFLVPLKRW